MKKASNGFTLIETVIAIGIVSFALLSVMGLLPLGLSASHDAQVSSVEAEIVHQVSNDLQNSPYSTLFNSSGVPAEYITGFKHFYDYEGRDLTSGVTGSGALPTVFTVTLTATMAAITGTSINTSTGIYGTPTTSGTLSTDAGMPFASSIQINVASPGKTDMFSVLVINKGY